MLFNKYFETKKELKKIAKKLEDEQRFFEISTEYEKELSIKKAVDFEAMMETGKKFNNTEFRIRDFFVYSDFKRKKYKLQTAVKDFSIHIGKIVALSFLFSIVRANMLKFSDEGVTTVHEIVKEYDANLEEYASQFNTETMSTMEIVMTVMNDIRSNTYYGIPEDEILIYPRLSLDDTKNIGTCRNMADKFTTIMNLIDPKFQAKNFAVSLDTDCNTFTFCDIERPIEPKFLEQYEKGEMPLMELSKFAGKFLANHLVTVMKSLEDDYYLVIDVTNPSIGIFKDGKVYTFNAEEYKFVDYRPFSQVFTYTEAFDDINRGLLLSIFKDIDLEEANEKYGVDAQNKVLEKIKRLD